MRSSCAGLTIDQSRHTATASARRPRAASIARATLASSSGAKGWPSESMRSEISNVRKRGTYGGP